MSYDTGVACPHCKQLNVTIQVDVGTVPTIPEMDIPVGPASKNYYELRISSFYCPQCQTLFRHPPNKPNAAEEILEKAREELRNRAD